MKNHRPTLATITGIILLGVALQSAVLFFALDPHKLYWKDARIYYKSAVRLHEGHPFSTTDDSAGMWHPPGYSYILSYMMKVAGTNVLNLRLFHVALFPVFLVLLYRLGAVWRGERTGRIAMILGALYPPYIYMSLSLYAESLLIYMYVGIALLVFLLARRPTYLVLIPLVLLISVAVMMRPTALILSIVAALVMLHGERSEWKRALAMGLLVIAVPGALATGWCIRNSHVHGRFTFSATAAGTLLANYNEGASWRDKKVSLPEEIQQKLSSASTFEEKDKIRTDAVRKFIREHPFWSMKIALLQSIASWSPWPVTMSTGGHAGWKYKGGAAVPFGLLCVFGIWGIVRERKDRFVQSLVLLMILNTVANGVAGVSYRYRVVTDFALILTASVILDGILKRCRRRPGDGKAVRHGDG
ncbi:MAG: glycosyltransferase family 39 protein [Candidatus Eisenbacteria bacterium]